MSYYSENFPRFIILNFLALKLVSEVKLNIDIPGKGNKSYVSATGGRISVVDIDSGSCSVELEDGNADHVIKINENCQVSGLATRHPDRYRRGQIWF